MAIVRRELGACTFDPRDFQAAIHQARTGEDMGGKNLKEAGIEGPFAGHLDERTGEIINVADDITVSHEQLKVPPDPSVQVEVFSMPNQDATLVFFPSGRRTNTQLTRNEGTILYLDPQSRHSLVLRRQM